MQQLPAWRSEPWWLLAGLGLSIVSLAIRNTSLTTGGLLLLLAVAFLAQTLVRDLVILWQVRRRPANADQVRRERCFCLETPVGMLFLVVALFTYWTVSVGEVAYSWPAVSLGLAATLLVNYLLRDLVFGWKPFSIRRDPAHVNIIPKL